MDWCVLVMIGIHKYMFFIFYFGYFVSILISVKLWPHPGCRLYIPDPGLWQKPTGHQHNTHVFKQQHALTEWQWNRMTVRSMVPSQPQPQMHIFTPCSPPSLGGSGGLEAVKGENMFNICCRFSSFVWMEVDKPRVRHNVSIQQC